jgi:hypothetical protein
MKKIKPITLFASICLSMLLSLSICTTSHSDQELLQPKIAVKFEAEPFKIYGSKDKDEIENTLTDTFCIGDTMVFSARSGKLKGEGPELGTNEMQIVIYKMPDEKVISILERHVAPDWHGTYHEIIQGCDCEVLEPGEYKIRFIKVQTRELYAKGSFRIISCEKPQSI